AVSVPPEVDFCLPDHVCAPVEDGAVALEYVTSTVAAPASESESTVIVWPETETVPADEVVWPAPAPVCGAVQPDGTSIVIAPFASVSESTVAVWPETETVPELAVTWPAPAPVCGAVQPDGTVTLTPPLVMPPVVAVYVNATVLPLEPARTELVGVVRVPLP